MIFFREFSFKYGFIGLECNVDCHKQVLTRRHGLLDTSTFSNDEKHELLWRARLFDFGELKQIAIAIENTLELHLNENFRKDVMYLKNMEIGRKMLH